MSKPDFDNPRIKCRHPVRPEDSLSLSRTILDCSSRGLGRTDFLRDVSKALLEFSNSDAIEIRLNHGPFHYRWVSSRRPEVREQLEHVHWITGSQGEVIPSFPDDSDLEKLCRDVITQCVRNAPSYFTHNGSAWINDAWQHEPSPQTGREASSSYLCVGGHCRSLAIIRFFVDEATVGLLQMKSERPHFFSVGDVEFYEGIAQTLGLAVANRRAEHQLRERVKELTCLYGIAQVAERPNTSLREVLRDIAHLLPPAWQFPEIAASRIILDDYSTSSSGFAPGCYRQAAKVVIRGRVRGSVEVVYLEERPDMAVEPFLEEEEKLITAVAREVALIVERKETEQEKAQLQQQLIHADRLATIGQLAAGVAHELNEPLGSILGFAQLARKCSGLPEAAAQDMEKIVTASLYAREVIKKLMVFARQVPARKERVNLNQVVEDGLYFLEARCAKAGTRVVRELAPRLPEISADPSQLKQVLVNLVVNALQAMPNGGTLLLRTQADDASVLLIVEDTGAGMSNEIMAKIFLPFFTTKDVHEGTGLGLAVVHGIISAHGGSIGVQSRLGEGSRFEIRLPAVFAEQV